MFELKNIKYKNIIDIDYLEIFQYKVNIIVGESGGGKTTLLKFLNGMLSPDKGDIYYNNKSIYEMDPISLRREVVMLPQNPVIFPGDIKENLLLGLKFSEKNLIKDRSLKNIMKMLYLDKDIHEDTKKLSGGEKQRVAIGRAIVLKPKVLLLDEPSSSLDEDTEKIVIRNLIEYSKEEKITLIMVTHSKKIAEEYGDNVIKIADGKIVV